MVKLAEERVWKCAGFVAEAALDVLRESASSSSIPSVAGVLSNGCGEGVLDGKSTARLPPTS